MTDKAGVATPDRSYDIGNSALLRDAPSGGRGRQGRSASSGRYSRAALIEATLRHAQASEAPPKAPAKLRHDHPLRSFEHQLDKLVSMMNHMLLDSDDHYHTAPNDDQLLEMRDHSSSTTCPPSTAPISAQRWRDWWMATMHCWCGEISTHPDSTTRTTPTTTLPSIRAFARTRCPATICIR